jgi:SpoU rRNA methylase family enzyme
MKTQSELNKWVYTTITSASALSGIPCYLNHAPLDTNYPVITFNFVSNPITMAMDNHNYMTSRVQINVYGNDQQYSECMDIVENLQNALHRKLNISLNNDITMICSKAIGGAITYFENDDNVWHFTQDYQMMVGN